MKKILLFTSGMIVGGVISWQYHKNKYEQMIQDDMESLRKHREKKHAVENSEEYTEKNHTQEAPVYVAVQEDLDEADNIIKNCGYDHSEFDEDHVTTESHIKAVRPYIIKAIEFASVPLYDTDTFYYHKNDIITNDDDSAIIDDVEYYLGMSTLEVKAHFGESEENPDVVYFRNDELKMDIEVLWDEEYFE